MLSRMTMLAGSIQYAYPFLRGLHYPSYHNVFKFSGLIPASVDAMLVNLRVQIKDSSTPLHLTLGHQIKICEYPQTFTLPATDVNGFQVGWMSVRLWLFEDKIRMCDQCWIPNETYDQPEYTFQQFEIDIPNNLFDRTF